MKKNRLEGLGVPTGIPKKMFSIVKLAILLTLVLNVSVFAAGFSQENRVSLKMNDVSLEDVILELRHQTGLRFFYSMDKIRHVEHLTVKAENMKLRDLLDDLLKDTHLTYLLLDDVIVIKDKSASVVADSLRKLTLKGVVKDNRGEVMPGVTVIIRGTRLGVSTDTKGEFMMSTLIGADTLSLAFSFVGMKTKVVKLNINRIEPLNVVMEATSLVGDEVVVTGYQTVKKLGMAGSSSSVKAADLVLNGTQTLEQALQGKLPGVTVMNQSGLTGTRQKVRVRGTSTLVGNPEPVWVVDGIIQEDPLPFNATQLTNIGGDNMDMIRDFVGGAISWLNPNDIDNLVVLKDASATAIYGVKAANGVIVITTKRGERGRMSLNYNGSFSTSSRLSYNKMELMNSQQRVEASREAYENGLLLQREPRVGYMALVLAYKRMEISHKEFDRQVKKLESNNTDWFDLLFEVPFSQSHNVSVSGGSDKTTYRGSFGVNSQNNTARGNSQDSYSGSLNVTSTFWDQLTVSLGLSGNISRTEAFAGIDPYAYATATNRVIPCYDDNGELSFYENDKGMYNILFELQNSGNRNTTNSVNSNLNLRWAMGKGFTLSSILGYNNASSFGESWYTEKTNYIRGIRGYEFGTRSPGDPDFINSPLPYGGELNVTESRNNNYTWRNQLEYVENFGLHTVTAMAGHELRSNKYDGYSRTDYGYMPDRGKTFALLPHEYGTDKKINDYARKRPLLTDRTSNYISYYANASYMFDERYALNASIRMDASNRFGQDRDTRYQPVWSVGGRWNVAREHWLENQNLLNELSFRASFGYQGNVVESVGPDLVAKIEAIDEVTGEYKMSISRLPTPGLKWEKNKTVNLGVDFSILHSKVNGSFEYYQKRTTDMIVTREVPLENGVTSMPVNGGNMKNSGWDLNISLVPVRTRNFVWTLGMNTSKVKNQVDSDLEPTGQWEETVKGEFNKKGYPVSGFWAFRFNGLNKENGAPEFDFSNANTSEANLDVTEYMVYAGKLDPDFTAGLNTSFRYKGITLSADFYLSTGNQKFLSSPYGMGGDFRSATQFPDEYQNMSAELLNRWRQSGDEAFTQIPGFPTPLNSRQLFPFYNAYAGLYPYDAWGFSDIRVVDAWYLRCNHISVGYTLPEKLVSHFARSVRFSFSVSNPFQIVSKDYQGRDPEVASGQQPMPRNYSLSVNLSF